MTAIINDAVAAVDLRADGHLENQDVFALIVNGKHLTLCAPPSRSRAESVVFQVDLVSLQLKTPIG